MGPETSLLTILSMSDIHLGHRKTPTTLIIANLMVMLEERLPKTKLLAIGGDLFDEMLHLTNTSVHEISAFILWLFRMCDRYGVVLRLMLGTFSHDRNQLEFVARLYDPTLFSFDFRYVDTIKLEYIEALDLRMLYLPDDLPYPDSDAVMAVVKGQREELGWDYVDYVMCHGWFEDVLPEGAHVHTQILFRTEQFDFVRGCVMCAHVHTHALFKKIFFYNSSFDRLCHGEEEPKGCMWVEDDRRGHRKLQFLQNKGAAIYRTIDLSGHKVLEDALAAYQAEIAVLPLHPIRHVRVIHPMPEVRTALQRLSLQRFPDIRFTHKGLRDAQSADEGQQPDDLAVQEFVSPTPDNLPVMAIEQLNQMGIPHQLTEQLARELLAL